MMIIIVLKFIDKIYLYVKDPNEATYQYRIKEHGKSGLKRVTDPKALTEYSNKCRMPIIELKRTSQAENAMY